ncbi:unnamed protein product [Bursaphelenchus xylophilus]|uniref:(pine wood nematode) hypothetical protein n=1 Tax=Bursaphelenchus xylophilus TaxID=6326 RepID=A0A1I7SBL9_BURXY|nr:unnamed protein product [Bursaphelenchus xylophilus]CAG9114464.1 unnamed protein product [Bursaphelenchus xylophilus]
MEFKVVFMTSLLVSVALAAPKMVSHDGETTATTTASPIKPDAPIGNHKDCRRPTFYACSTSCQDLGYATGHCKIIDGEKKCVCTDKCCPTSKGLAGDLLRKADKGVGKG